MRVNGLNVPLRKSLFIFREVKSTNYHLQTETQITRKNNNFAVDVIAGFPLNYPTYCGSFYVTIGKPEPKTVHTAQADIIMWNSDLGFSKTLCI